MSVNEILGIVYCLSCIFILFACCVFLIIYTHKVDKLREQFIKELNEHDRSVITSYNSLRPRLKDIFKISK